MTSKITPTPVSDVESGDIATEGAIDKQLVQDNNSEQILTDILKELKKMNLHLSIINDDVIKNTEVE